MSILVILIPVLIFAFQFYEITVQSVAAPKLGTGKSTAEKPDNPPLNLTVLISRKGFQLKQDSGLAAGEAEEPPLIPKRSFEIVHEIDQDGQTRKVTETVLEYDYPKLYSLILEKKKKYPEEDTINIGADFDVPWSVVARTIDCVRVYLEGDDLTELEAYRKARPKMKKTESGEIEHEPLFPKVVFVVAN